ncbi:MAG: VWA domain-containing protein, partial [Candidatus Dormibacteraeota bacterium]|nr:VWA domain-containing protein [Candidatus Dormibacteraeota bacterium]
MTAFTAEVHQNEYLPRGWPAVHAIVTVGSRGTEADDGRRDGPEAVEVIMLDCSSSMGSPASKIETAVSATRKAIDRLRDGTWFAIVAGTSYARMVYPEPKSREAATMPVLAEASWAT